MQTNNNGKSLSNRPEVFANNKNQNNNTQVHPPCPYCKKTNHPQKRWLWSPDVRCHRCGQLRHVERICKFQQQQEEVKVPEDQSQESSGCTNHMTYDRELFTELDEAIFSKVKIENGAYIEVKGKGIVAIEGHTGLKLISDVLYVPEISQNLLSVPQLLEKGYKVLFEDKNCMIKDS